MLFCRNIRKAVIVQKNSSRVSLTGKCFSKRFQSSSSSSVDISPSPRGKERTPLNYQVGEIIHGFKVERVTPVPERNLKCFELEHETTGAKHLHIECDDTNNVFCATFKTTPTDSTGVAHILEHTTLCGSTKYPVRDPFFNMTRRSLSNFMNAWTASDHTSYPFATQNEKDYFNLLSVYLDAVFYPKLDEIDFRQEGHRLEFENMEDPNSNLTFKGVVYNEMKGVLADPSNIFGEHLLRKLFPTTTYSHNSGGEPVNITDLTYDQLLNFHKTHYHPSNTWFFTYGDLPLEPRLKFLQQNALSQFDKFDSKTEVTDELRWSEPRRADVTSPPAPLSADPERQTKVSVAYLFNNITDSYETFVLSMLGALLTRGPSSPFYRALIDSNLGYDYAPGTGYEANNREGVFSIGLNGINQGDIEKVTEIINTTLEQVASDGFEPERIESILHQIELSQKNVTANFGLHLLGVVNSWLHGGSPAQHMLVNQTIARFREDLAKGPLFQNKIKQYLLNNAHKLTLVMNPDEQYLQKESDIQAQKLKTLQETLSQAEKEEIIKQATILKSRQELKQDASVLPSLRVSDIPLKEPVVAIENETFSDVPLQWIDQPTNGITYFRALLDLGLLREDLRVYLPLFCSVLTEMGAGKYDHRQLAQEIDMYTSGIDAGPSSASSPFDIHSTREGIHIHSACLDRNMGRMFDLLRDVFVSPKFDDTELLHTLIAQRMSNLQDSINQSGSSYAKTYAASGFNRSHHLKELWGGMTQISFLQKLSREEAEELVHVIEKLKEIAKEVLVKNNLKLSVVSEAKSLPDVKTYLGDFIHSLPSSPSTPPPSSTTSIPTATPTSLWQQIKGYAGNFVSSSPHSTSTSTPTWQPINTTPKSFFVLPSSVNYVAKCLSAVPYTHEDSARLQILLKVLGNCYLHTEIREKGGAYGSGASLHSGIMSFSSYRDPNITKTLSVFDESLNWVNKNIFTDQDIVEAKISVFSDIDAPTPPSGKGSAEFYRGITAEMRQKRREQLLATDRKDIIMVAEKYLSQVPEKGVVAVLGGEEMAKEMEKLSWHVKRE